MSDEKLQSRNRMSKVKSGYFDAEAFYAALDAQRLAQRVSWRQVAEQSGVSASSLTRMAQGRRPDVDSLAALTTWSGLSSQDFVRENLPHPVRAEALAMISSHLKADPNLTREGATALDELIKATYERLRKRELK
jgi:transcriptional regulator with XRE-family HTH domain